METTINVQDYLSEYEMKQIAQDVFRSKVAQVFSTEQDIKRVIGNLSFQFVWDCVDKEISGNLESTIKEKVISIINEMTTFCLFRKKDAWEKEESVGQTILNQAVTENASIIYEKVKSYLENFEEDEYALKEAIKEAVIKKIMS